MPALEMGKKKRAETEQGPERERDGEPKFSSESKVDSVDGEVQKKKKKKEKKRKLDKEIENGAAEGVPTVSVAVPGSIIGNAQSLELATRLAGQIARAATIFRIDEVVVFDNKSSSADDSGDLIFSNDNESGAAFLIKILQYLETPQYLRKALFPRHTNLRYVGVLPPLDAPHHLRKHEWASYREGVTLKEKAPKSGATMVDVGLSKHVAIDQEIEPGRRVTIAMGTNRNLDEDLQRQFVSHSKPREAGIYWGYRVRYASNISSVFNECPYNGGYDIVIGTSEHGAAVNSSELDLPNFRHLLIAFGGLAGLEESIEADDNLKGKSPREVFHQYLNTCPQQGSRTIRTEEAIFISLQYFQEPINRVLKAS